MERECSKRGINCLLKKGYVKLSWPYCESQYIIGKHKVHTLHKLRRYISSQNHMAMRRETPTAYKVRTPSSICRCGINHSNRVRV